MGIFPFLVVAWVVVAAVLGYIVYVLKPFGQKS